jgi:hypothetical protein
MDDSCRSDENEAYSKKGDKKGSPPPPPPQVIVSLLLFLLLSLCLDIVQESYLNEDVCFHVDRNVVILVTGVEQD